LTTYDDATTRPEPSGQPEGRRRAAPPRPDGHQAGEDILGILRSSPTATRPAPVVAAPPVARPTFDPTPELPEPAPVQKERLPERMAEATGESTTVDFTPKKGARRVMSTALALVLIAAVGAGLRAYNEPTALTIGIAATLGVLLLVIWGVRAASPLTLMTVKGGQLEVKQGGLHLKFDLSSHYTPIEVQGAPGRRDWRVLFGRGTLPPFVVDATMVDAAAFMDVVERYHPQAPTED
jgi:hypothetical protein